MNKDIIGIGDIVEITGVLAELYPNFEWEVTGIEYRNQKDFYIIIYPDNRTGFGSKILQCDELKLIRSADYDLGI
jgi:hypothetical protein